MVQSDPVPRIPFDPSIDEWPNASALATQCFLNLGYLFGRVEPVAQALFRRHQIPSATAFNILTILDGAGASLSPSTIADHMVITRGTVTSVVDSLVRHGLVKRDLDNSDGRMRLLSITAEGQRRARAARDELHAFENRFMSVLTSRELETLLGLVARLQESISDVTSQRAHV